MIKEPYPQWASKPKFYFLYWLALVLIVGVLLNWMIPIGSTISRDHWRWGINPDIWIGGFISVVAALFVGMMYWSECSRRTEYDSERLIVRLATNTAAVRLAYILHNNFEGNVYAGDGDNMTAVFVRQCYHADVRAMREFAKGWVLGHEDH